MRKISSFEDLENALRSESIPTLDKQNIINAILTQSMYRKAARRPLLSAVAVILIFTMLLTTVIIAGPNLIRLYRNNKVVFELGQIDQSGLERAKVLEEIFAKHNYDSLRDEIQKSLKPGEIAWVVLTEAYASKGYYDIISNPVDYTDLDKLRDETGWKFKTPSKTSRKYRLEHMQVTYSPKKGSVDSKKIAEELFVEAQKGNKEYAIRKQYAVMEPIAVHLRFSSHLTVLISKHAGIRVDPSDNRDIEKIMIGNKEALYERKAGRLIFVDGYGKNRFTYYISGSIDVNGLIRLAESFK